MAEEVLQVVAEVVVDHSECLAVLVVVSMVVKEEVNLHMATDTPLHQHQQSDLHMPHNMVLDNQEAMEGVEVAEASMVALEEDHMEELVEARASS